MRILRLAEIAIWIAVAAAIALNSERLIIAALTAVYGSPGSAPPELLANLIFISPLFPLVLGILAAMRLTIGGEKLSAVLGFSRAKLAADLGIGLLVGAVAIGIAVLSLTWLGPQFGLPNLSAQPPKVHIFFMTIGAIIPGFCEELYYRGMLLRIAPQAPAWLLVLLSAAGFALWHPPAYWAHTFVFGLMLGALAVAAKRLAPAILAHTFANAGFGLLLLFDVVQIGAD